AARRAVTLAGRGHAAAADAAPRPEAVDDADAGVVGVLIEEDGRVVVVGGVEGALPRAGHRRSAVVLGERGAGPRVMADGDRVDVIAVGGGDAAGPGAALDQHAGDGVAGSIVDDAGRQALQVVGRDHAAADVRLAGAVARRRRVAVGEGLGE